MPTADEYLNRFRQVIRDNGGTWENEQFTLKLTIEEVSEAKRCLGQLRLMEKHLRQIKREVDAQMKTIRAAYKQQSASVSVGAWALLMRPGRHRTVLADKKRQLSQEQARELAPFDSLKLLIDQVLVQVDGAKVQLQSWVETNKAN